MLNWILVIWIITATPKEGFITEYNLELLESRMYTTEQECLEEMKKVAIEDSWIATCIPEEKK